MSKPKFAWTWADYERELAKDERRAARARGKAAAAETNTVADAKTATRARPLPKRARCEGEAPEGSSGAATAGNLPANASQARPFSARPIASLLEDEDKERAPAKRLSAPSLGNDRGGRFDRVRPPDDIDRLRRALSAAADTAKAERARATGELEPATSREECRHCGIPGFKGCEHQAPYQEPGGHERAYDYKRAG